MRVKPAARTLWFRWSVRPVRAGWYEYRGQALVEGSRYWNGSEWGTWSGRDWWQLSADEGDEWRGLTEPA